jgi:hypothetical protein
MYHVLQAVRDGMGDLPAYKNGVVIDIPLERVDAVQTHNHTYVADLVGTVISSKTLEEIGRMDLLSALSLCQRVYEFEVYIEDGRVYVVFPPSSRYSTGIAVPLLYEDPHLANPPDGPKGGAPK